MKKILLITALLFIFNYAKPQSIQQELTAFQNNVSPLRLDRYIDVRYDENSLQSKHDVVFDANGNQTLFIEYYWNTSTQSFVPNYKVESSYDANGNQTLRINYSWNTVIQSFVPDSKIEYTFDTNGNQTLEIGYSWNIDTQSFVPNSKYESTYDANGNPTLSIGYSWSTDAQSFIPYNKFEYTIDANGYPILIIRYSWNTETQYFVPNFKEETTYDANGNRTLYIGYSWNIDTQSFVPNGKGETTYDANGNQTLYINYSWNTNTQTFVPTSKDVRTYNNGLPITFLMQKTIYKWYSELGVYKPSFKTEYATILDTDTQLVRKGVLYRYDTNFNVWNELVGDEYNSYEYYTKTSSLSNETINNNLTLLYPNPVINVLNIKVDDILINQPYDIFDSLGRVVLKGKLNEVETTINVEQLSKGIYYLKVSDKNASKFIKE
jgi:hypothetical protein